MGNKKSIRGVMNDNILKIEEHINLANFKTVKILGAGGGGYILIKYQGKNLERDKEIKKLFFDLIPVTLSRGL